MLLMKRIVGTVLLVTLVAGVAIAQLQERRTTTNRNGDAITETGTISVTTFNRGSVIGHLGHPLGTVVRITGKAVDGDTTRMKRNVGKTLLEIYAVNGKELESKITFDFPRDSGQIAEPNPGNAFDYYVHEYGIFDGVVTPPKELGIDSPMVANDGFHYRRRIAIHKSMK